MTSAARKGDQHACPQTGHGVNGIATGSPNVFINGVPAARIGDSTSCGANIISGSSSVFINGLPAAIMGSATSHGGVLISGSGNVLIGDQAPMSESNPTTDKQTNWLSFFIPSQYSYAGMECSAFLADGTELSGLLDSNNHIHFSQLTESCTKFILKNMPNYIDDTVDGCSNFIVDSINRSLING